MGFPRQEHWGGLPFPSPGDLPDPGTEPAFPMSPAWQADSLPVESSEKAQVLLFKEGLKCWPQDAHCNGIFKELVVNAVRARMIEASPCIYIITCLHIAPATWIFFNEAPSLFQMLGFVFVFAFCPKLLSQAGRFSLLILVIQM